MEQIDLKWNSLKLGFDIDEFDEPVLCEGLESVSQSITISIRGSEHTRKLINSDQSDSRAKIISDLEEEIEAKHEHIILGSISINLVKNKLVVSAKIQDEQGQALEYYFEEILS